MEDNSRRAQFIPRVVTLLLTLLLAFVATCFIIAFAWKPIATDPLRLLIPQLSAAQNVSNTSGSDSSRPAMVINGGNIYVAWREGGTPAEIYFNKKVSGSWSGNVNVSSDSSDSAAPAIAVTSSDVHLVWQDGAGWLDIVYKQSSTGGTSWGAREDITNNDDDCSPPAIAISGTVPHVVWAEDGSGDVFYSNRTGGVPPWTTPISLTASTAGQANRPSIGAGNYRLHVTWDVLSGTSHIEYSMSTNGGASWSAPQDISGDITNDGDSTDPDIAVQGSNVFVVWNTCIQTVGSNITYTIRFNKSTDGGGTWLPSSTVIATPTINIGFINRYPTPRVAISDTNTIYVTWHQGTTKADVMCSVSTDGGNSWSTTPDNVSNSSENSQMARIAIGTAHVVWEEEVNGKYEIYYKSTTGIEEEDGGGVYLPIIMKSYR